MLQKLAFLFPTVLNRIRAFAFTADTFLGGPTISCLPRSASLLSASRRNPILLDIAGRPVVSTKWHTSLLGSRLEYSSLQSRCGSSEPINLGGPIYNNKLHR